MLKYGIYKLCIFGNYLYICSPVIAGKTLKIKYNNATVRNRDRSNPVAVRRNC
jgi:hypothetical protein